MTNQPFFPDDSSMIFDGAMGTLLQNPLTSSPTLLNLQKPSVVLSAHQKYNSAGAQILTTNTFLAGMLAQKEPELLFPLVQKGIEIAKQATKSSKIAQSVGPLPSFLSIYEQQKYIAQQAAIGQSMHIPILLLETYTDLPSAIQAITVAEQTTDQLIFCTMAFPQNTSIDEIVSSLSRLVDVGAHTVGINCSFPLEQYPKIAKAFRKYSDHPLLLQPNAGIPTKTPSGLIYPVSPTAFATTLAPIATLPFVFLGGCCGTTPAHISALVAELALRHR